MPQGRLRAGLGVFAVLCSLFGINLFAFQGAVVARNSKLIAFPASAASETIQPAPTPQPASVENTLPTPTPTAATLKAVTTGSVTEPDLIRAIQRELQVLGYEAGGVDGRAGMTTRAAVMAFEWDQGLPLTAEPAETVFQALLIGGARAAAVPGASSLPPSPQAASVVRFVQQGLAALGYRGLTVSGTIGPETQQAIRLFEAREGLPGTGRVSGSLTARITRLTSEKRLAVSR
jgi:peptidoglycan hydrolase-like protein with peptidoglycan-binding domain